MTECQVKVLKRALNHWGVDSQHRMAIGEMGELLALFGKQAQNRATHSHWIDEISDVLITVQQLAHIHGYDEVQTRIQTKLKNLDKKLDSQGAPTHG